MKNEVYYFYILICNNDSKYYGHTNNLAKRFALHAKGHVISTRQKRPVKLVYFEECETRSQAFNREMQFKNGRTRKKTMDRLIASFLQEKCQGLNSRK